MKYVQKLVLVLLERWEKIGDNIPVKEVVVKSASQMNVSQVPHQKKKKTHTSQMKRVKKPGRFGDRCVPERNSDVSFSNSGEEGGSIETV